MAIVQSVALEIQSAPAAGALPRDWPLTFSQLTIRKSGGGPISEQILRTLRAAILTRELPPGAMFPPSRELAEALGVGRNTIIRVYAKLMAEGHVISNTRRGTRVAPPPYTSSAPDVVARRAPSGPAAKSVDVGFHARQLLDGEKRGAFTAHEPDPLLYPRHILGKLIAEEFRHPPESDQCIAFSRANLRLQHALARHLRLMRGVFCEPEQIIPTTGLEAAVALTIRVMIDPGHSVHLENPTFKNVRDALRAAGANIYPLALPGQAYENGQAVPPPRMIFASPSVNFPFGHQMPEAHRHALLNVARSSNAVIFESDVGAELMFAGDRRQAMQGEDRGNRVIYFGSFSETLGPHIQMGYLVVPPYLVEPFSRMAFHFTTAPSQFVQSAVARFIEESRYAAHVKNIRARYAERAKAVAEA
ncbi:MAG: PLP-dependent aminotransferase family protein, partial [Rhizomicrobium sp.]